MTHTVVIETNKSFAYNEAEEIIRELLVGTTGFTFEFCNIKFDIRTNLYPQEIETYIVDALADDFDIFTINIE